MVHRVLVLAGVIHLRPLPGSPRSASSLDECIEAAAEDALALARAKFDAIVVENFGDAPFFAERVPPITVAAMTACALAVREAASGLEIGINVLRNDAESALAIALATGASFIRVNVHVGARVTDQGIVEGRAAKTLRSRRALGAERIAIWADVDVKHSSPLGLPRPIEQEVEDLVKRGMADTVLVTGEGTGKAVDVQKLAKVKAAAGQARVLVASGATVASLPALAACSDGVVVGTALRASQKAGDPVDATLAASFADAFRTAFRR